MPRVLIVEDQAKLRRNLQQILQNENLETCVAGSGEESLQIAKAEPIDVVILDLNLPGKDGLQVLADLRRSGFRKPVLILTARDSVDDRVAGLDSGADDYLVKPFAHTELLARLRALLRRSESAENRLLRCGDLEMDLVARRVVRRGAEIELTQREFELLAYLLQRKNTAVSRESLARDVWKEPAGVLTNAIDVCVNSLRKRIEVEGSPSVIHTVRGVGYAARDPA